MIPLPNRLVGLNCEVTFVLKGEMVELFVSCFGAKRFVLDGCDTPGNNDVFCAPVFWAKEDNPVG